jgi:hypothetical protein
MHIALLVGLLLAGGWGAAKAPWASQLGLGARVEAAAGAQGVDGAGTRGPIALKRGPQVDPDGIGIEVEPDGLDSGTALDPLG